MNVKRFSVKKFETIPEKYQKQIKNLTHVCFRSNQTPEEREIHEDRYFNTPKFLDIVAIENNYVVGKVGLCKREVKYEGVNILLGGLGGVCTLPEKRKKGVASTLLPVGMEELKKAGCDIAYLCTDIKDPSRIGLYGKVGFVVLGKPHSYQGKSGKLYTDHDGMIALVNSQEKFSLVMNGKEIFHIGEGNW